MGSKELTFEVQEIINKYTSNARECFQNKDFDGFIKWQLEKWNTIPDPKEDWEESFRTAKVLITLYSKYQVTFEEAKKWLSQLSFLDEKQQQHPGEFNLMKGKVLFEEAKYDDALDAFKDAYIQSEGHCFGAGDDIYFDFYRNPEKYIK